MEDQANFKKLLLTDKKDFKTMKSIILQVRKNLLRFPDAVLECGVGLLKKFRGRLGDDYYIILEELFYAALDCQKLDFALQCFDNLRAKFGNNTPKVQKMLATYLESTGDEKTDSTLDGLIAENPLNLEARKRKIAFLRGEGEKVQAIIELNKYLDENMVDKEAWLELADIYLENLDYPKALYCFEQVILLAPKNFHYYVKAAELLYTIGGTENLVNARQYYSLVIASQPKNAQALYGLLQTCKTIEKSKKGDARNKTLLELTFKALKKLYSDNNSDIFASFPGDKSMDS